MTPQERKVMELALKALGENVVAMRGLYGLRDFTTTLKAVKALEEALAQPEHENKHIVYSNGRHSPLLTHMMNNQPKTEQEPVKLVSYNCKCGRTMNFESVHGVVAPQRTWVGLNLDERAACYEASGGNLSKFVDQIEAKLKEKNSA